MNSNDTIAFIGLGVMGGAMSRNIATKHAGRVIIFDLSQEALDAMSDTKAEAVGSIEELAQLADVVFLSLPGGVQVEAVTARLARTLSPGSAIVDLSTTPVAVARKVSAQLESKDIAFADAPVARTREAAQRGELSIMVGAPDGLFDRIQPMLAYMATDISHGGDVGSGQVLKLINNMLVFANTAALAEMIVLGEQAGLRADTLLNAVSKGSGDSFVLRNHGVKHMAPRNFPDKSFPPEYVLKDIEYVLELARDTDVSLPVARTARAYYEAAVEHGLGEQYFPGIIQLVERGIMRDDKAEAQHE